MQMSSSMLSLSPEVSPTRIVTVSMSASDAPPGSLETGSPADDNYGILVIILLLSFLVYWLFFRPRQTSGGAASTAPAQQPVVVVKGSLKDFSQSKSALTKAVPASAAHTRPAASAVSTARAAADARQTGILADQSATAAEVSVIRPLSFNDSSLSSDILSPALRSTRPRGSR